MNNNGVQQAFAACPLLFCGWIALTARTYHDTFEVECGTKNEDAAVYSYEPYVRDERLLFGSANGHIDRTQVLKLAYRWDTAVKKGELKPLRPISFEDSCTDGVRGGIFRSKSRIVSYLQDDAGRLMAMGKCCDATEEILLAVRLSESSKYGDFASISYAAVEERRELSLLNSNARKLCKKSQKAVRLQLLELANRHGMLVVTTEASSARFYDYQQRFRGSIGVSEIRQTGMLGRRIRQEGREPQTLQMVRKNFLNDNDSASLEYLCALRLAWRSERETQERVENLMAKLTMSPNVRA